MRRIFIKTCLSFAILSISVLSFSQQGVQNDSLSKANPAKSGMQTPQNQNAQNNAGSSDTQGQAGRNTDLNSVLQPDDSYPVNQNLEMNKENLVNPLTNSLVNAEKDNQSNQGIQGPVTPGVQNSGDPAQALPSGMGSQSVPGKTEKGLSNQKNPGINNNPGVPNDKGTQNPDNIQKDQDNKVQGGKKP